MSRSSPTVAPHGGEVEHEHHHRDIQGGAARAAVFGVSDGLVSNVSLILGVAGANPAPGVVRLAGLAGLVGGAFSMAAGEYVSMKAQRELLQRELAIERREIEHRPEGERRELAQLYRSRGVDADIANRMATEMMRDPDVALEVHAREELGVDPGALGSPWQAAAASFVSFAVGAIVPLIPWLVARGRGATIASVVLGLVAAVVVGAALARFTGRSWVRSALRQVVISSAAAAVTFTLGAIIGSTGAV